MNWVKKSFLTALVLTVSTGINIYAQDNGTPGTVLVTRDGGTTQSAVVSVPETISDVPSIQSEYARLRVSVTATTYNEDHINVSYPQVTAASPIVQERINKELRNYANKAIKDVQKANLKNDSKTDLTMKFSVKSSTDGIFSVVVSSYTIQARAAHGINVDKGFTFNTTTGKQVTLSNFGRVTKDRVTEVMNQLRTEKGDNYFFSDVTSASYVSNNFFSDNNRQITIIYPQGELGPMSSGIIYIPLGKLK